MPQFLEVFKDEPLILDAGKANAGWAERNTCHKTALSCTSRASTLLPFELAKRLM